LLEVDLWVSLENGVFDKLDLIVEALDFVGTHLVQSFVEKWDILEFEHLFAFLWELVEEASHSSWMNDLVAWA
jgi:hypothetical protein